MGWYVRNSLEPLIEGAKASETIEYNNRLNKNELKQIWMREKNELWTKTKQKESMDSLYEKCQK